METQAHCSYIDGICRQVGMENIRMFRGNRDDLALGNNLTLEELAEIEEMAHRSHSREAEIILRLSAALREAMQVRESAIALMRRFQ